MTNLDSLGDAGGQTELLLSRGAMDLIGLLPWSSNYTFLVQVKDAKESVLAVYKPSAGERPLWDFGLATLCNREVAAYRLSCCLGWPSIPPTVLREGPHGPGSLQLYIDADHQAHYFNLRDMGFDDVVWQKIALFDAITNNADRKGGHCLLDGNNKIWAIDHGLTFHHVPKLRTVIWDYAGEPIPQELLCDLESLKSQIDQDDFVIRTFTDLLTPEEIDAFVARLDRVASSGQFPEPGPDRSIPYPLV